MSRRTLLTVAIVLGCGLLTVVLLQRSRGGRQSTLGDGETASIPLPDYGRLKVRVTAGGVQIFPGQSGVVRITLDRSGGEARLWQRVHGSSAELKVDNLGGKARITVEVPRHTDLDVELNAGELKVHRVSGHKDLDVRAGRIEVQNSRSEYGRVNAFVLTGRIAAPLFGNDTGGIWRSRRWKGIGDSRLNATVLTGEVDLRESPRPQSPDISVVP